MSAFFQKIRLLLDWFLDWVILPWFQPNPDRRKKSKDRESGQP